METIRQRAPDFLKAALIFFGTAVALLFLWKARNLIVALFLAVLIALVLKPAVDFAQRFKIPRGLAAAGVVLLVLSILTAVGFVLAPTIRDQFHELTGRLPQVIDRIERAMAVSPIPILPEEPKPAGGDPSKGEPSGGEPQTQPSSQPNGGAEAVNPEVPGAPAAQGQSPPHGQLRSRVGEHLGRLLSYVFPVAETVLNVLTGIVLIVFIALYLAVDPRLYRKGILHLVPQRGRKRAEEVLETTGSVLRQWFVARLIAMVVIGLVTGLGLMFLGIESALALGVLAGLLEFIPFFGPILAAVPAIGVALLESNEKALWVVLLFVVIQQFEGNLLTPLLLKNRIDVPPALTITAVAALGLTLGVGGIIIAEPLVVLALVLVKMLYVQDVVRDPIEIKA